MSAAKEAVSDDSAAVSIHYIICECGETFPTENGLREHLEKEHPHKRERKEYKCGVCGWIYSLEEDCIAHYEEAHMDADHEYEEEEECKPEIAEQEVVLEQQYEEIVEEDVKPNVEEIQEYVMEDGEQYLVQIGDGQEAEYYEEVTLTQEHESEDVSHDISQEETARATQLLVKSEPSTDMPKANPPPLKMVRDPETGALVLVYSRTPPRKVRRQTDRQRPPAPAPKHIVCETCGRKYASAAALKYHQRVHTGDKPYQCHLCPKAFTMPLFLQIHVRTHTGERPYQCPECPKAFSNKAALLRHDRVHTGAKPYVCPMCLKSFTQSNSMKLHVATVHLKQPAPYKSRNRRARELARGTKHPYKSPQKLQKIKAFAPQTERARNMDTEMEQSETMEEDEMNCHEVIYEEEIQ